MHANFKVRENFLERSGKSQGILKSWNAGHPVIEHIFKLTITLLLIILLFLFLGSTESLYEIRLNEFVKKEEISGNFQTMHYLKKHLNLFKWTSLLQKKKTFFKNYFFLFTLLITGLPLPAKRQLFAAVLSPRQLWLLF